MLSDEQIAEITQKVASHKDLGSGYMRHTDVEYIGYIDGLLSDRAELLAENGQLRELVKAAAPGECNGACWLAEHGVCDEVNSLKAERDAWERKAKAWGKQGGRVKSQRDEISRLLAENKTMGDVLRGLTHCEYCVNYNPTKHDVKHKRMTCGGNCNVHWRFDIDRFK